MFLILLFRGPGRFPSPRCHLIKVGELMFTLYVGPPVIGRWVIRNLSKRIMILDRVQDWCDSKFIPVENDNEETKFPQSS